MAYGNVRWVGGAAIGVYSTVEFVSAGAFRDLNLHGSTAAAAVTVAGYDWTSHFGGFIIMDAFTTVDIALRVYNGGATRDIDEAYLTVMMLPFGGPDTLVYNQ